MEKRYKIFFIIKASSLATASPPPYTHRDKKLCSEGKAGGRGRSTSLGASSQLNSSIRNPADCFKLAMLLASNVYLVERRREITILKGPKWEGGTIFIANDNKSFCNEHMIPILPLVVASTIVNLSKLQS